MFEVYLQGNWIPFCSCRWGGELHCMSVLKVCKMVVQFKSNLPNCQLKSLLKWCHLINLFSILNSRLYTGSLARLQDDYVELYYPNRTYISLEYRWIDLCKFCKAISLNAFIHKVYKNFWHENLYHLVIIWKGKFWLANQSYIIHICTSQQNWYLFIYSIQPKVMLLSDTN